MPPWQDSWFDTDTRHSSGLLWRGVEAQHRVATMRLVDSLAEQAELERLLEASKPPLPVTPAAPRRGALHVASPPHYLLSTPFRYHSPHPSRFRAGSDPGLWYGAKERETACVEVAYWRWRFLMDSAGLRAGELVTEHTLFQAQVRGLGIDLAQAPWASSAAAWMHPSDYSTCHALARAARSRGVQWIRYTSVRRPGGRCAAVLAAGCLSLPQPLRMQTWVCKVTASQALMLHDDDGLTVLLGDAETGP